MLELLVGMVILGILGAIGYGIYTNFIGDARDTALDQNIQSAAAELQSVLALEPTLANSGQPDDGPSHSDDEPHQLRLGGHLGVRRDGGRIMNRDIVRYQFITDAGAAFPTNPSSGTVVPATVNWLVDGESAVRIHLANPEGEWRCALLILKPSTTDPDSHCEHR